MKKLLVTVIALAGLASTSLVPAMADPYYGSAIGGYFEDHPYVQKALIGGGLGTVAGAVIAPEGDKVNGAVKGAVVGGAAGAGYEYLQQRGVFDRFFH